MGKTAFLLMLGLMAPVWALEVNHATEAELDGLRGLGPALEQQPMASKP